MPSATYRMHQKLSDGSYQAIHAETEAGVVLRPNGDTVEQTLRSCVLAEDAGDNVPGFKVDAATLGGSTKEEIIASVPAYTHPSTIQCNVATEINNLKSSVSSGKTQIANAITGKGVTTSSSTSFATMASNINSIATIDSLPTGAGTLISEVTEYQSTFTVPSNARYGYTFLSFIDDYVQCVIIPQFNFCIGSVDNYNPKVFGPGYVQMATNSGCGATITFNGRSIISVSISGNNVWRSIYWYT